MANFLADLPCRGVLPGESGSLIGRQAKNYVCDHSTAPPEDQVIVKDQPCILVGCLQKSKQREAEAKRKEKADNRELGTAKRKQAAGATGPPAKKQNTGGAAEVKTYTAQQLRTKSGQELSEICKSLGAPVSGKKDALVLRILQAQEKKAGK